MSLTAISAPRSICSPSAAFEPVIGPTTAIGIFCAPAPPAPNTSAAAATTDRKKRLMNTSPHFKAYCNTIGDSVPTSFEIGGPHLGVGQELGPGATQHDSPGLHHIAAMGQPQGVMGVLL